MAAGADVPPSLTPGAGAPGQPAAPGPDAKPLVLVADDNTANQKVAAMMLAHLGYRTETVADGRAAVEATAATKYAAVLMDCRMPEMDGYEATTLIRRREQGVDRTPILAMTAGAMPGERERALAAGMDDIVIKPVTMTELGATLQRWVDSGAATPDQTPPGRPAATPAGPVLDPEILGMLRQFATGSRPGAVHDVVEMFLETAERRLGELRAAVASGDAPTVAFVAHNLKGSSANVAAARVAALAGQLETAGRAADVAGADALVEQLAGELREAALALRAAFPPQAGGD